MLDCSLFFFQASTFDLLLAPTYSIVLITVVASYYRRSRISVDGLGEITSEMSMMGIGYVYRY